MGPRVRRWVPDARPADAGPAVAVRLVLTGCQTVGYVSFDSSPKTLATLGSHETREVTINVGYLT